MEDPYYAAAAFYQGTANNAGLFDVWSETRSTGSNVQAVQRSAFPGRYDAELPAVMPLYDRLVQVITGAGSIGESTIATANKGEGAAPVLSAAPINPGLAKAIALAVGALLILMALVRLGG